MKIGQKASQRVTAEAAEAIREAIREVGGREVFFAGALDGDGRVYKVKICARGHEGAVPAYAEFAKGYDAVLHNHPTGDIAPSDADLELSSLFGFHGLGVYITDNDVDRVYVVVEPFQDGKEKRLTSKELASALTPSSALGKALPHFEVRPQQTEMMQAVGRSFNENGIAVVEAPTGVGKTIAYLLPAVLWAVRNKERVVVSTRTINLQEQIVQKDIPLLAKCLKEEFSTVLVKGRSNYMCWRRLERAQSEATLFDDETEGQSLEDIREWAKKTKDGTRSDLPFMPSRDLWDKVCSEGDTCQFTNCPKNKDCFFSRARRDVSKADVIVANHHMLFSDLSIKKEVGNFSSLAVLPAFRRVIFDEAHNVEDSATEYFGADATRLGSLRLIGRFVRMERRHERGLLPLLKLKLIKEAPRTSGAELDAILDIIDNNLMPGLAAARESLVAMFEAVRALTAEKCGQIGREVKWRLTAEVLADPALRELHAMYVLPATEELQRCAQTCTALHRRLKALKLGDETRESPILGEVMQLLGYRDRLSRLAGVLAEGTSEELPENTVRWIEIDAYKKHLVRIARCPLHVGKPLAEWVYGNLKTVVMTSATLSVDNSFDFLYSRLGLDRVKDRSMQSMALDSPFDFRKQAMFSILSETPAPDDKRFLDETVDLVREALLITKGHAFVLFTSFYALDYVFKRLAEELQAGGIVPLKQGAAARTQLLDRFRNDPTSVLFGTDSFWEGVDVAGQALQCVILPKLPFRVPTEPVLEARSEAIAAAGGNSFMEYTVPQAVIKFRQGFGRLIRRKTDRGAVIVLDPRIVTKHYGKIFLRSLPDVQVAKGPREQVYASLRDFFNTNGDPS